MVRFKSLVTAFLLGLASLSASYAEDIPGTARPAAVQHLISNSAAEWNLQVQLNHPDGIYQIGERMTIQVSSPRECYVHIVNVNPGGEVNVLWPMDSQTSNRVSPGQEVVFPDRGAHPDFVFEAAAPVGKELIVCFATKAPLNLKSPADAKMFGEFLDEVSAISPHPLTRLRSFVTKIEPERTGWTATAFELETREKDAASTDDSGAQDKPNLDCPDVHDPRIPHHEGKAESTCCLTATTGNVSVDFSGPYQTEAPIVEVVDAVTLKTTITTQIKADGVFLFSETVITTPVDELDEKAVLNGITIGWRERFKASDDQVKPIQQGRFAGCEFFATGSDGIRTRLRAFVDRESRATYIIASLGTEAFVNGPESSAFISSMKIVR